MDSLSIHLGQVLAEHRRRAGLTQEALAFRCGRHFTYISRVETGRNSPSIGVLSDIAEALGTRPSELLREAEERVSAENA